MIRYLKISFVLFFAIWAVVSLMANLINIPITFKEVHSITIMSMFKPGEGPPFATESPTMIWLLVALLMLGKVVTLAFCSYGTVSLWRAVKLDAAAFQRAKCWGIFGGGFAVAWFFIGFVVVGEHIFFMFLDPVGLGAAQAAFRYAGFIGIMTLFVAQPD
jgi:predicted small integral membrane protein